MIEVLAAGARTTIQDLGRFGARHLGMAPAGPFDALAARAANHAVGNPADAALLEVTVTAPTLRFGRPTVVAFASGHGRVEARPVAAGETLAFGGVPLGVRGYVAIRGGVAVEPVRGSRATHVASGIGPPPVERGLRLAIGAEPDAAPRSVELPPPPERIGVIGLHEAFEGTVDPASDRTGVRIRLREPLPGAESDPEPILPGMIQVPPSGDPIVLGPDGPTTGGYRLIGIVAPLSMRAVAQARPGATVRFFPAAADQAEAEWNQAIAWLDRSI